MTLTTNMLMQHAAPDWQHLFHCFLL